ncbi:MAG: hypothetical protein KAR35_03985 [Candidatus Heimdallarchaeota archaeon]|nr:hypothetical protein [Candidatus Heimdallarchaeota archaeon]MCK5048515.1 hypothetical protein [Candidatus Heimdallarchaeota archaeon]
MANITLRKQRRETEASIIIQMKDGMKTLLQKVGKAVFETEIKNIPENRSKQRYDAEVSTIPVMRLQ